MRRRCCARRHSKGFVLLYALGILLGATMVLGAVVGLTLDLSREAATERDALTVESALESAVHDRIFGLIDTTPRPGEAAAVGWARSMAIRSDGLIDVNRASDQTLERLFRQVFGEDRGRLVSAAVKTQRPITSYAHLVAASGASASELACLLRYTTLFSGRDAPDPDLAPVAVKRLLGLRAMEDAGVMTASLGEHHGRPWSISVEVGVRDRIVRRLMTEVIVTNRADRPFGILDRRAIVAPQVDQACQ